MSGFFMCSTAVLTADISATSFKVYCYYAISANSKTRASYKSKYTIAKDCGISRSTLLRATKELCEQGLLKVEKRFDNGRQIPNRYILTDSPEPSLFSSTSLLSPIRSKLPGQHNKSSHKQFDAYFKCYSNSFFLLSAIELKIYAYLSMRMDKYNQCFPAKKEVASSCGISISTVTRAIKKISTIGLIKIIPQTRKSRKQNNGTSANLYRHSSLWIRRRIFLALFCSSMTPSPVARMTPQRTTSMKKVTLKQRKKKIISKLPTCKKLHKNTFSARQHFAPSYKSPYAFFDSS